MILLVLLVAAILISYILFEPQDEVVSLLDRLIAYLDRYWGLVLITQIWFSIWLVYVAVEGRSKGKEANRRLDGIERRLSRLAQEDPRKNEVRKHVEHLKGLVKDKSLEATIRVTNASTIKEDPVVKETRKIEEEKKKVEAKRLEEARRKIAKRNAKISPRNSSSGQAWLEEHGGY